MISIFEYLCESEEGKKESAPKQDDVKEKIKNGAVEVLRKISTTIKDDKNKTFIKKNNGDDGTLGIRGDRENDKTKKDRLLTQK